MHGCDSPDVNHAFSRVFSPFLGSAAAGNSFALNRSGARRQLCAAQDARTGVFHRNRGEELMRKAFQITQAVMMAGLLTSGFAYAQTPTADQLEESIDKRWEADATLKACQSCDFDVEVAGGIATISGEAPTAALRARAERLANVTGITRVDNQIKVVVPTSAAEKTREGLGKAANKTAEGVDKAAEKTGEGVSKAADKTGDALAKTGEVIDDTWITTKVKSQYMTADAVEGSSINVDTKNNVVTLNGSVPTEAARTAALRIARETKGVKRVVDNLRVGPKTN
jgi:osmotically-inducible protein OsmY